jgi:hypothetical protein
MLGGVVPIRAGMLLFSATRPDLPQKVALPNIQQSRDRLAKSGIWGRRASGLPRLPLHRRAQTPPFHWAGSHSKKQLAVSLEGIEDERIECRSGENTHEFVNTTYLSHASIFYEFGPRDAALYGGTPHR